MKISNISVIKFDRVSYILSWFKFLISYRFFLCFSSHSYKLCYFLTRNILLPCLIQVQYSVTTLSLPTSIHTKHSFHTTNNLICKFLIFPFPSLPLSVGCYITYSTMHKVMYVHHYLIARQPYMACDLFAVYNYF